MKRLGCSLVLLVGCGFQGGASGAPADGSSQPGLDAAIDNPEPDAIPDARTCFGTGVLSACLATVPSQPVALPAGPPMLDTNLGTTCTQVLPQPGGPDVCVIAGTTVTVTGTVIATGGRPLVLIGTDTVTINGTIDVSSVSIPRRGGAGSGQGPCINPSAPDADTGGGGGGAGGSLGTKGGKGGTGDHNMTGPAHTMANGSTASDAQPTPAFVRGGCRGGAGGDAGLVRGGAGGDGGGAIYLIAGNKITITGDIFASGAGGGASAGPAGIEQGGGGGGSGGLIGLEAPSIEIASTSHLVANGGAGGGGGGLNSGGTAGGDGTTANWNARASGGNAGGGGTGTLAGGAPGSARGATDGIDGPTGDGGGGGGGGGLGILWISGTMTGGTAMMSPQPTMAAH